MLRIGPFPLVVVWLSAVGCPASPAPPVEPTPKVKVGVNASPNAEGTAVLPIEAATTPEVPAGRAVIAGDNLCRAALQKSIAEVTKLKTQLGESRAEAARLMDALASAKEGVQKFRTAEQTETRPTDKVVERASGYLRILEQALWRNVTVDELCEYFTCDSVQTTNDVKRIIRDQRGMGKRGKRVLRNDIPSGRVESLADGKVQLVVESVAVRACRKPGEPTETSDGVHGCRKAYSKPWKMSCHRTTFEFRSVDGVWKRTGLALEMKMRCL